MEKKDKDDFKKPCSRSRASAQPSSPTEFYRVFDKEEKHHVR